MNGVLGLLGAGSLLLLSYAALDRAFREERLARWLDVLDRRVPLAWTGVVAALGLLAACCVPWELLGKQSELRHLALGVGLLLSWNAATRDRDPVVPGPSDAARGVLCLLCVLSWWSPLSLGLTALLLSARFGFWQHHAAFPMRVHLLMVACATCAGFLRFAGKLPIGLGLGAALEQALEQAFLVVVLTMMVSHYVVTALAKIWLGPRPWSWMLHNRLHFLAASAYSWGWARFAPWPWFHLGVLGLQRIEVPLQVVVFALELTCPLALLDHRLAAGYAFAFAGFHVGVWLVSGLCFWDWMLTDLLLGVFVLGRSQGLGLPALAFSLVVLVVFPLRHKLWKPMPLGWFDSPLTQRVHWFVRGASGQEYRLTNGFMCPHERLYGKVHGAFAVDLEMMTYHLGECFLLEVREAIVSAGPNLAALEQVRRRFGIRTRSDELTAGHVRYLQAFFARLNAGAPKAVLPRWARWLKAPGDQMFYWGEGVAYRRQEPATAVWLVLREEYFDGRDLVRLREQEVLRFEVPPLAALVTPAPRELTPREMDDYLLGLAKGRLIRVAGGRRRYLSAEDGIRVV